MSSIIGLRSCELVMCNQALHVNLKHSMSQASSILLLKETCQVIAGRRGWKGEKVISGWKSLWKGEQVKRWILFFKGYQSGYSWVKGRKCEKWVEKFVERWTDEKVKRCILDFKGDQSGHTWKNATSVVLRRCAIFKTFQTFHTFQTFVFSGYTSLGAMSQLT